MFTTRRLMTVFMSHKCTLIKRSPAQELDLHILVFVTQISTPASPSIYCIMFTRGYFSDLPTKTTFNPISAALDIQKCSGKKSRLRRSFSITSRSTDHSSISEHIFPLSLSPSFSFRNENSLPFTNFVLAFLFVLIARIAKRK